MIVYMAGQAQEVRKMKYRSLYEHALFSRFVHSKRNMQWMQRRKERELAQKGAKA